MNFSFNKIISASLSPNTDSGDVWLALQTIVQPWIWKEGNAIHDIEQWFIRRYPSSTAISFNSGRSALYALLQAFEIGKGDEVLLQAFTCVAVPNSVKWACATPVFVDIDETLNIDVHDAERKLTGKTKALIIQHTFGVPADMDKIVNFCRKHKILLIEDCAHSLGAASSGKLIGSFGDAAFFSFGRDKVVSSVWGGMGMINDQCQTRLPDGQVTNAKWKLQEIQKKLQYPSFFWIFQQLLHPIVFCIILRSYNIGIGRILLFGLQKMYLLSKPVYPQELTSGKPAIFPSKYPNALAILLRHQIKKLERINSNRRQIAMVYRKTLKNNKRVALIPEVDGALYLRFPIFLDQPLEYIRKAKAKGIVLGNWYHHVIDPAGVDYTSIAYREGSCPNAERLSKSVLNLPTRITTQQADQVLSLLS